MILVINHFKLEIIFKLLHLQLVKQQNIPDFLDDNEYSLVGLDFIIFML